MGECRFYTDRDGFERCRTHDGDDPTLCTHAAAELKRRVEAAESSMVAACRAKDNLEYRLAQAEAREAAMREAWTKQARPLLMADYKDARDLEAFIGDAACVMDAALSPDACRTKELGQPGSRSSVGKLQQNQGDDPVDPALTDELRRLREVADAARQVIDQLGDGAVPRTVHKLRAALSRLEPQ